MNRSRRFPGRWPLRLGLACMLLALPSASRAANLAEFGRCLSREGAVFYGTSWCPYCKVQRQTLGSAMPHVRYVECSADGGRDETAPACVEAGVRSYPTWVFADGSRLGGAQPLSALAAKTGCTPPGRGPAGAAAGGAKGGATGPKIIEVPQQ